MIDALLEAAGIDLGTWALMLLVAWYLFRGARVGKQAGSVLGRVVTYLVLVFASGGIAMALGWAQLDLPHLLADVGAVLSWLASGGLGWVSDFLGGVL